MHKITLCLPATVTFGIGWANLGSSIITVKEFQIHFKSIARTGGVRSQKSFQCKANPQWIFVTFEIDPKINPHVREQMKTQKQHKATDLHFRESLEKNFCPAFWLKTFQIKFAICEHLNSFSGNFRFRKFRKIILVIKI